MGDEYKIKPKESELGHKIKKLAPQFQDGSVAFLNKNDQKMLLNQTFSIGASVLDSIQVKSRTSGMLPAVKSKDKAMHMNRSALTMMEPHAHQKSAMVGTRSISPFQLNKTGTVFSRDTSGSQLNPSPNKKPTETIQLDCLSGDQRDRFSRIVFDNTESNAEVTSVLTENRIKIQDALNLIHGGNPGHIAPIAGSRNDTVSLHERASSCLNADDSTYCGEKASDT